MSVTFFAVNAPTRQVVNEYFDPSSPEDEVLNPKYFEESMAPEFQMSNTNFDVFIRIVDPNNESASHEERIGSLVGEELLRMYHFCDYIIEEDNVSNILDHYVRQGKQEGNVIYCGLDHDQLRRYFLHMMELTKYCIKNKYCISFA